MFSSSDRSFAIGISHQGMDLSVVQNENQAIPLLSCTRVSSGLIVNGAYVLLQVIFALK